MTYKISIDGILISHGLQKDGFSVDEGILVIFHEGGNEYFNLSEIWSFTIEREGS